MPELMNRPRLCIRKIVVLLVTAIVSTSCLSVAQEVSARQQRRRPFAALQTSDQLRHRTWEVDKVQREALVYIPEHATEKPVPVVFVFHGHGGNMRNSTRQFPYYSEWPDAISIYPQGLKTPGQLTDPEGKKSGWQKTSGDQNDRDLHFFDTMLKSLREEYKVDNDRIYSTGHSNGGGFTYLLWSERGDEFAAMAPSGAAANRLKKELKPKPVFHVAGDNDPLVKFEWQRLMIARVVRLNGCGNGQKSGEHMTIYPSESGTPVVTWISHQGHKFPQESVRDAVAFLKQQSRDGKSASSGSKSSGAPESQETEASGMDR
ncbi:MAG: hypothetical protein KDA91_10235 [Planctomycetaceae bacterium]|nr:hypothetical protein [Planctomycetaceae bacterium]